MLTKAELGDEGGWAVEDEGEGAKDDFTTGGGLEEGCGPDDDRELEPGGLGLKEGAGEELLGTAPELDWELGLGLG